MRAVLLRKRLASRGKRYQGTLISSSKKDLLFHAVPELQLCSSTDGKEDARFSSFAANDKKGQYLKQMM